jgi:hypothetical protein
MLTEEHTRIYLPSTANGVSICSIPGEFNKLLQSEEMLVDTLNPFHKASGI